MDGSPLIDFPYFVALLCLNRYLMILGKYSALEITRHFLPWVKLDLRSSTDAITKIVQSSLDGIPNYLHALLMKIYVFSPRDATLLVL